MAAVERKTRYTLIGLAPNKIAKEVKDCIIDVIGVQFKDGVEVTSDNQVTS